LIGIRLYHVSFFLPLYAHASLFLTPEQKSRVISQNRSSQGKLEENKKGFVLKLTGIFHRPDLKHWIVWINGQKIDSECQQSIHGWTVCHVGFDHVTMRSFQGEEVVLYLNDQTQNQPKNVEENDITGRADGRGDDSKGEIQSQPVHYARELPESSADIQEGERPLSRMPEKKSSMQENAGEVNAVQSDRKEHEQFMQKQFVNQSALQEKERDLELSAGAQENKAFLKRKNVEEGESGEQMRMSFDSEREREK
jgi:hypothetical protein